MPFVVVRDKETGNHAGTMLAQVPMRGDLITNPHDNHLYEVLGVIYFPLPGVAGPDRDPYVAQLDVRPAPAG